MTKGTHMNLSRRRMLQGGVAALGLPTMAVALAACSPKQAGVTSDYAELITRVSDLVIPQTDTPGAIAAGVPDYVRAVVGAFLTEDEQAEFKAGLSGFDEMAHGMKAESFLAATADQQTEILTTLDADHRTDGSSDEERDLVWGEQETWQRLRDLIVFGYYTSEVATEELSFDEIPGRYVGDVPLTDVGRAWLDRGV